MDRIKGFIWIGISYILAFSVGFIAYFALIQAGVDTILSLFILDIIATIIVWAFGLAFRNSSFYDPYWSITPLVMVILLLIDKKAYGVTNIIFVLALAAWSLRLTINWATTFTSINVEDWRYVDYRNKSPKLWPIINFFGINMMPTLLVFAGLLPGLSMMIENTGFKPLSLIGTVVIIWGFLLELLADRDMHKHLATDVNHTICQVGLWKYSRHPNYLGEISIWFGIYFMLLAVNPSKFYLGFGAIAILALFVFISIPMMEKRQIKRRPAYIEYKKTTSMLLLWRKNNKCIDI